ncbi:MAG: hypothetical protein S0880_07310 [Actinomycetota bacterium]|nr:hypothetical protein [Actinomycetota bacterium]
MFGASTSVEPASAASAPDWAAVWRRAGATGVVRLDDGRWLVASPDAVAAVLGAEAASVVPAGEVVDRVGGLQRRMARFSDGADHGRRRAAVVELLDAADPVVVEQRAAELTTRWLDGRDSPDAMALAREVPARVLAEALGLDGRTVAPVIDGLCRRLAPMLGAVDRPDPDEVADAVTAAFGPLDDETVVARVSILFQAMDATAALIGVAARRLLGGHGRIERSDVERVARSEPPVQLTVRRLLEDVSVGSTTIPAGSDVVVGLAAAELAGGPGTGDGPVPWTFGRGPHRCPGAAQAGAITAGVLGALAAAGAHLVDQPIEHEPRPNLRTPASLTVTLRSGSDPAGDR